MTYAIGEHSLSSYSALYLVVGSKVSTPCSALNLQWMVPVSNNQLVPSLPEKGRDLPKVMQQVCVGIKASQCPPAPPVCDKKPVWLSTCMSGYPEHMPSASWQCCLCPGLWPWLDWLWLAVKCESHRPSCGRERITWSDTGSSRENHHKSWSMTRDLLN